MRFKFNYLLLFISMILFIGIIGYVEGACVTPVDDLPFNISMTFADGNPLCGGVYYLNDTAADGLFKFSSNKNITIEGNGTIIIGNKTGYGILGQSNLNATISGISIYNFAQNMRFTSGNNINIVNMTLGNSTDQCIRLANALLVVNISNSYFDNCSRGIDGTTSASNLIIQNDTFNINNNPIYLENNNNNTLIDNIKVIGSKNAAVYITTGKNVTIKNSNIDIDEGSGIYFNTYTSDVIIDNIIFTSNASSGNMYWIYMKGFTGVTIKNCRGTSNDINNLSLFGIWTTNMTGMNVYNNTFIFPKRTDATNSANFRAYGNGGSDNVSNNNFTGLRYGIYFDENNSNNIANNNIVSDSGLWGIAAYGTSFGLSSNNTFCYNKVYRSSWNGIAVESSYNTVCYNYVEDFWHNGIDTHTDGIEVVSCGNNITYNNVTRTNSSDYRNRANGIYVDSTCNESVTYNRVWNIKNESNQFGMGISVDGTNYSYNNYFGHNTIDTTDGYAIYDAGSNNTWEYNTLTNVEYAIRRLTLSEYNYTNTSASIFKYNNRTDKTMTFYDSSGNTTSIVYQSGLFNISVAPTAINPSYWILLNLSNTQDVYYVNGSRYIYADTPNVSTTLSPSDIIEVKDGGCNRVPSINASWIAPDSVICGGTYNINSTSAGIFGINASNVNITCNNTIFVGNLSVGSRVFQSSLKDNIKIVGCTMVNYSTPISIQNGENITLLNNTIVNTLRDGMLVYGNKNMLISGNYLYAIETFSSGFSGINMVKISSRNNTNALIYNNTVIGFDQSIYCQNGTNITIDSNYFDRSLINSVQFACDYSTASNNLVTNATRNGISVDGKYINVTHNTIINQGHGGIDLYDIDSNDWADNAIITQNDISGVSTLNEPEAGIYICNSTNHVIYNNTIHDLSNTQTTDVMGIKSSCDIALTYNNYVYNNTVRNVTRTCFYITDNSTTYENNTLESCGYEYDIQLRSGESGNTDRTTILKNNKYVNGFARIWQTSNHTNFIMLENTSINLLLTMSINSNISFNYSGVKNLNVTASSISINNQSLNSPYNDVKNSSNNVILSSNINNYSITLIPNQQIEVGYFVYPNFTFIFPPSPTGSSTNKSFVFVGNVSNNRSFYNRSIIVVYDSLFNLVYNYSSNSTNISTSRDFNGGTYTYRAYVYDTNGFIFSTPTYSFSLDANYGTSGCDNKAHPLWIASILIVIVGMLYLLFTTEFTVFALVVLSVAISLIVYLINLMYSVC